MNFLQQQNVFTSPVKINSLKSTNLIEYSRLLSAQMQYQTSIELKYIAGIKIP